MNAPPGFYLDTVSTTCDSGWVRSHQATRPRLRTHPLSQVVLTVSKCEIDKMQSLHQLNALTILRHVHVPTKLLFDMFGHRVCGFGLAVRQKRRARRAAFHAPEPAQHFVPARMRGEAADLLLAATNRNP